MTDILTPIPDNNHPRKFCRWHCVPHWLHWLCIGASAASTAFGGRKTCHNHGRIIYRDYDFMFFRLLEVGDNWFFRAL